MLHGLHTLKTRGVFNYENCGYGALKAAGRGGGFVNFFERIEQYCIKESELMRLSKSAEKITDIKELDRPIAKELREIKGCPIEGNGGNWEGERGNSTWHPDRDSIPKNPVTNPDGLTWNTILDKYGIDGICFKDGEPDFSTVSKGTVEIGHFTDNRYGKGGNFEQACEKLAEAKGCTAEEVKTWMKDNKYTWHERNDCKTMDKVPSEVHGNIRHSGGISEVKSAQGNAAS